MIRLAAPEELSIKLAPGRLGVFAVKQFCQAQVYGQTPGVFSLWIQRPARDRPVCAAVSKFSGVLTVSAVPGILQRELEELAAFLLQIGGDRLEGEQSLLQLLGIAGDALLPFSCGQVMRLRGAQGNLAPADARIHTAQTLAPVYHLLCAADEHFAGQSHYETWLADFSHRCRHQSAQCLILIENQEIVSTLSISFLWGKNALVGGVATHPQYRGRGYAGALLTHLHELARKRGLSLWLLAADETLAVFYRRFGWEGVSRWASRALAPV